MNIPLQIEFRRYDPSPALRAFIGRQAQRLACHGAEVKRCAVIVDVPQWRARSDTPLSVGIHIARADGGFDVHHEAAQEQADAAIRDAFDMALRQLDDDARAAAAAGRHAELIVKDPGGSGFAAGPLAAYGDLALAADAATPLWVGNGVSDALPRRLVVLVDLEAANDDDEAALLAAAQRFATVAGAELHLAGLCRHGPPPPARGAARASPPAASAQPCELRLRALGERHALPRARLHLAFGGAGRALQQFAAALPGCAFAFAGPAFMRRHPGALFGEHGAGCLLVPLPETVPAAQPH